MSTQRNRSARILLVPFGCKVSRIEALSALREVAERRGSPAPGEGSELVLVHGCAVTAHAERDVRKEVRRLRREHPGATIVLSGCLARATESGLSRRVGVDRVEPELGRHWSLDRPEAEPGRARAFLKIQDGCNRRCAYCVVPALRGPERSAPAEEVLRAIRSLGGAGVPEVVLSGVHLAAYDDAGDDLLALLERLEADPPSCRVRLSSLEPMEAGQALVDFVASSRTVVPYLHLPLQSGSDSVLRRMQRGVTRARYEGLALRAVLRNPRLHLATDVIAGFPGETDREHDETLDLIRALPLASIHAFPFSPRPGTAADSLHREAPVPPEVVRRRAAALRRVAAEKLEVFRRRAVGSLADVVALHGGEGLTDTYLTVSLDPEEASRPGARFLARLVEEEGALRASPVSSKAEASC